MRVSSSPSVRVSVYVLWEEGRTGGEGIQKLHYIRIYDVDDNNNNNNKLRRRRHWSGVWHVQQWRRRDRMSVRVGYSAYAPNNGPSLRYIFDVCITTTTTTMGAPASPPPRRIPSAAASILLLFGVFTFFFFSFPLGDGSTFIIIIIIINLLYYIDDDDDDDDDYDGGKRKYVTVVIVDGGACAPNNPTWARPDRGTQHNIIYYIILYTWAPALHPWFHSCRRRRRLYYIIIIYI